MSLFNGSECGVNSNQISQFNKFTQQDKSLQRLVNTSSPGVQRNNFKNDNSMSSIERQNLDKFMNNGSPNNFNFQPIRHELDNINVNNMSPRSDWMTEFNGSVHANNINSGNIQMNMNANLQQSNLQQSNLQQSNLQQSNLGQVNGGGNYLPSFRNNYMQSNYLRSNNLNMTSPREVPKVQEINWDNQFEQIESELKQEVEQVESEDIIVDDKYQATFQEVWDNLNDLETDIGQDLDQDFITKSYEEFKSTQGNTFPSDNIWDKDFAKYASTRANFGEYEFEESNQFLNMSDSNDLYEIGCQLMENGAKLSEAALAFEAAIQNNQNHINAWLKLGQVQTQNEKEIAGISALEKCLELNPENSEALMTLAISYINEGYDNAAFATLERWIHTKYPQIVEKASQENPEIIDEDRYTLNKRVCELFLKAAQLSPNKANMDSDVQMGLGVLFYADEDFDKTIDCFKAALSIKPDDPILWNRLGASLANSNKSEEAVEAYFKALELKPTFVRARYNLGVSCINIGCYKEAAQHLLSGLAMHQVEGVNESTNGSTTLNHNQSTSLTETLKRAFIIMERRDLLEKVKPGMDLNQFRDEFDF